MTRYARPLLAAVLGLAIAGCSADAPAPEPEQAGLTETSRAAVTDYARLLMVDHNPEEAFGKYYADLLIQHDPMIADGGKGDAEFLRQRREADPGKYDNEDQYVTVVHTIMADGDLVGLISHVFTSPSDPGRRFVDIWRMENGEFAEHWDVIQPIDDAARAGVGCGIGGTYEAAKAAGDTVVSPTCGLPDLSADTQANRALAVAAFEGAAASAGAKVERVLADGDLVLIHSRVTSASDPRGVARADLYRLRGGSVADHWEVTQPIPEFSASGRSMTGAADDPLEPGRVRRAPRPGE